MIVKKYDCVISNKNVHVTGYTISQNWKCYMSKKDVYVYIAHKIFQLIY